MVERLKLLACWLCIMGSVVFWVWWTGGVSGLPGAAPMELDCKTGVPAGLDQRGIPERCIEVTAEGRVEVEIKQCPACGGHLIDRLRQVAAVSAEHTSIVNSSQTMAGVKLIEFADGYAEISNREFFGVTLSPHQYDALFDMMTKDYDVRMKGEVADLLEEAST